MEQTGDMPTVAAGAREGRAAAFRKMLIVLGAAVLVSSTMVIVHECGHVVAAVSTGGEARGIEISPLGWSYAMAHSPEEHAVSWGGFLLETAVGVLTLGLTWCFIKRLSALGVLAGITGLMGTGIYMVAGAIGGRGDSANLIDMGISPVAFYVIGPVLILLAAPLILPVGALMGIGRGRCRLRATFLVLSPLLAYAVVGVVWNVAREDSRSSTGVLSSVGELAIALLAVGVIHFCAPWFDSPEYRRREMPSGWPTAILLPVLAGGLVAGELVWLGPVPRPTTATISTLTWFGDETHYAGYYRILEVGEKRAEVYGVFRRDGGALESTVLGSKPIRFAKPSSGLGGLLVVREDGLFVFDKGEFRSLWSSRVVRSCVNTGATRALVVVQDVSREAQAIVAAVDLQTGKADRLELGREEDTDGQMVFVKEDTACFCVGKDVVTAVFDGTAWRFTRGPSESPEAMIVGSAGGRCVWGKMAGEGMLVLWKEHRLVLPEPVGWAVGWEDGAMLTMSSGQAYRMDASGGVSMVRERGRFFSSQGVCPDGLWGARREGEVEIRGRVRRSVRVEVPGAGR